MYVCWNRHLSDTNLYTIDHNRNENSCFLFYFLHFCQLTYNKFRFFELFLIFLRFFCFFIDENGYLNENDFRKETEHGKTI